MMLKANKRTMIITSIVTVLPILIGLILWKQLPDTMAIHFGADSEANGFASKGFAVFAFPLILLALHWIAVFFTANDPRKQNISPKLFTLVLWLVPVISLVCCGIIYFYNLGYRMDISFILGLLLSVMLIVLGNYMPKTRHNYTIGIRIPWTLANEENWNRTHRMAGFLWMAGGIVLVVLKLLRAVGLGAFLVIFLVLMLIPIVYSFWLHSARSL